MNGHEQTLSDSILSPEMLSLVQENSEPLEQSTTGHGKVFEQAECKRKRKIESKGALQRMVELSEEMGLYDE